MAPAEPRFGTYMVVRANSDRRLDFNLPVRRSGSEKLLVEPQEKLGRLQE